MTDELRGAADDTAGAGSAVPEQDGVDGAETGPVDAVPQGNEPGVDPTDDQAEDGLFPAPVLPAPQTGDELIDEALNELQDSASTGSLDDQLEAGETVHRTLRDRLSDLGGE